MVLALYCCPLRIKLFPSFFVSIWDGTAGFSVLLRVSGQIKWDWLRNHAVWSGRGSPLSFLLVTDPANTILLVRPNLRAGATPVPSKVLRPSQLAHYMYLDVCVLGRMHVLWSGDPGRHSTTPHQVATGTVQ